MTKVIAITLLTFSLLFSGMGFVFSQDEEDLQRELDETRRELREFQDLVTDLLGEEEAELPEEEVDYPGRTIEGIPEHFTFTTNLSEGQRGEDVEYLQILLNEDPDTLVAQEGPGSPGQETDYFGPLTTDAVVRFQEKYVDEVLTPVGLTSGTGYVGAQTRAKLNELLGEPVEEEVEDPDVLETILNQMEEFSAAIEDIERRVGELADPTIGEDEGELTVERRGDIRGVEIGREQTKDIGVWRFKAEDSDITVQRIDVYVEGEDDLATNFRGDIDWLGLYQDGEIISERDISRATVERGDSYIRLSGLNVEIEEDGYVDLTFALQASDSEVPNKGSYDIGPRAHNVDVSDSVRGVDEAGLTVWANADNYRSFTLTGEEEGYLRVRRHTDNPQEGIALVEDDRYSEVELLRFEVTARDSDIESFDRLQAEIELSKDWDAYFMDVIEDVILYEEDVYLDDAALDYNGDKATAVFDPGIDFISEDETIVLSLVADVGAMDIEEQGESLRAVVRATDNTQVAYDVFDNQVGFDGNARGYEQSLYVVVPDANLSDSSIRTRGEGDDRAEATLDVDLTALGGEVYLIDRGIKTVEGIAEWTEGERGYSVRKEDRNVVEKSNEEHKGVEDLWIAIDDNETIGNLEILSEDPDGDYDNERLFVSGGELLYESGDMIFEGVLGNNVYLVIEEDQIYFAVADDGDDFETDYYLSDIYRIEEDETETLEFVATSKVGIGDWVRFEVDQIRWFTEDDGQFIHQTFTRDMDQIDDLETGQIFVQ